MNITYEFVTGEKLEIEVSEAVKNISIEIDRGIYNSHRKETRRHNSIENMQNCGFQFQDTALECNIEAYMEKAELIYEVREAISTEKPADIFIKETKNQRDSIGEEKRNIVGKLSKLLNIEGGNLR